MTNCTSVDNQLYNPLCEISVFRPCLDLLMLDQTPDDLVSKAEQCFFSVFTGWGLGSNGTENSVKDNFPLSMDYVTVADSQLLSNPFLFIPYPPSFSSDTKTSQNLVAVAYKITIKFFNQNASFINT
jgi:hypothetical protein